MSLVCLPWRSRWPLRLAASRTLRRFLFFTTSNGVSSSDPTDFSFPALMAQGHDGNIYTTSVSGGVPNYQAGTFFGMTPAGSLSSVFTFYTNPGIPVNTGCNPYSGVTLGADGNFYGAALGCAVGSLAPVFQMTPNGDGTWNENVLYDFIWGSDGSYSYSAPIQGTDGNFYGTNIGGAGNCGTIYQVTPGGVLTTLHTFGSTPGCSPYAPLLQGTDGNFYGTTEGGSNVNPNAGVVALTLGHFLQLRCQSETVRSASLHFRCGWSED
jgi:uncharacterized repeat protein (TIGR03803 family)